MTYPAQKPNQRDMRALFELYNSQQRKPETIGLLNRLARSYVAAIDDLILKDHPEAARAEMDSGSCMFFVHPMGNGSAASVGRHAIVVLNDNNTEVGIWVMANGREYVVSDIARFDISACARELFGPTSFEEL